MKLKKTWIGVCVFVIYLVGIIFATGVTGFVSGLFLKFGQLVQAIIVAACAVVLGLIISFAGNRIGKSFIGSGIGKNTLIEVLSPIFITICGVLFYYFSSYMSLTGGNMALYEGAKVTGGAVLPVSTSILDYVYMLGLRGCMLLLGNGANAVVIYNIVLRAVLLLCLYFSLRMTIGILGAYVSTILVISIPVFANSLSVVSSANLFFAALFMSIFFTVMLAKGMNTDAGNMAYFILFDIIVGALWGFTVFMDLGGIALLAIAFAAFFVLSDLEEKHVAANVIIYLITGIATFAISIIGWYGNSDFIANFWKWANQFYGINNSELFVIATESIQSLTLILILFVCAIAAAFAYVFSGRCERVVPWFFYIVLASVLSVVLGKTATNDQVYLMILLAIGVGCLMSCIAYKKKAVIAEPEAESQAETENNDEAQDEPKEETEEKVEIKATSKEISEVITPEEKTVEAEVEETEVEETEVEEKPRFVPEGMVLPMGDEDEESLVPHFNLKRNENEDIGVISLNRDVTPKEETASKEPEPVKAVEAEEKTEEISEEPITEKTPAKDDFDISIEPGDDFDI
ncbi:MAG: hypothetical protein E7302_03845 [Butyrivibrio sp.]|nr:hypothetical protein [Butyrivibrio sp.]